ncbi:MAG: SGNH/GDSL hydrolase family protein [Acidobacteria bacterium]|nr:SGNH/GDSL hydrolase family protein [Acidobacteriota bacterium]
MPRSRVRLLLAAAFWVTVAALLAELVVRTTAPQSVAVPWQDEMDGIAAPRRNVHGRHAVPGTFDTIVSIGPQRFRGRSALAEAPAAGTLRVAVLGDSFVFGYGANDDETYPAELQRHLWRAFASTRRATVEVLNAGNGGTGTGVQALWYTRWVSRFHPAIVILTVVSNDVDDDLARPVFEMRDDGSAVPRSVDALSGSARSVRMARIGVNLVPGYALLAQHSQLVGLVRNQASALLARERRRNAVVEAAEASAAGRRFRWEGLPRLAAELAWLEQQVARSRARLIVVFVPSRESVYGTASARGEAIRWKSADMVRTLREASRRIGVTFADLTGSITDAAARARPPLYYDGLDTHPNPRGYRTIAEQVASVVIRDMRAIEAGCTKGR